MITQIEKRIFILYLNSFTTSFGKVSKLDANNPILFQIQVFSQNIKETTLTSYFKKVPARLSFTPLSSLNNEMKNAFQRFSCISFLFKLSWFTLLLWGRVVFSLKIIFDAGGQEKVVPKL